MLKGRRGLRWYPMLQIVAVVGRLVFGGLCELLVLLVGHEVYVDPKRRELSVREHVRVLPARCTLPRVLHVDAHIIVVASTVPWRATAIFNLGSNHAEREARARLQLHMHHALCERRLSIERHILWRRHEVLHQRAAPRALVVGERGVA